MSLNKNVCSRRREIKYLFLAGIIFCRAKKVCNQICQKMCEALSNDAYKPLWKLREKKKTDDYLLRKAGKMSEVGWLSSLLKDKTIQS